MKPRYETYETDGRREWLFLHGPADGEQVLIVPPLFEELNFTRAIVVALARELAGRGIGASIADLPGTGESDAALEDIVLADWRGAVAAAAARIGRPHVVALRGGTLIDDAAEARSWWRFAASDGAALIRQMERAQTIGDRESKRAVTGPDAPYVELIGYRIGRPLRDAVRAARPATPAGPLRTVPFEGPGVAPWRRAEPTPDAGLAAALAADIAEWIATCGS